MYILAALTVLVVMFMALIRAFIGPSLYDRILAVNNFGTKTVLLLALIDFIAGRPDFLDIAIVYALINFISIIGVLRFFEYSENQVVGEEEDGTAH